MGEFLTQYIGASTLKGFSELVNSQLGITGNKQMKVVRFYFQGKDFDTFFLSDPLIISSLSLTMLTSTGRLPLGHQMRW